MRLGIANYDAKDLQTFTLRAGLLTTEVRKALADALDRGELSYKCDLYHKGDREHVEPRIYATKDGWALMGELVLAKICPLAVKTTGKRRPWDLSGIQNVYLLMRLTWPYLRNLDLRARAEGDFMWMEGRWPELRGLYRHWSWVLEKEDDPVYH